MAEGELAIGQHGGKLRYFQSAFQLPVLQHNSHAPPIGFGVLNGGKWDAVLPGGGWKKKLSADADHLPAMQQRLPQLLSVQRLCQIPGGPHLVAFQGHLPVAGNKDDGHFLALLSQLGGQRHAIDALHDHIQQKDGKGCPGVHGVQKCLSTFKAVDVRFQPLLLKDLPDPLGNLNTAGGFIIADRQPQP